MYLATIFYSIILLTLVWFAGRSEDSEDFLIAGRNRNLFQLTCSKLCSSIGAGWFLAYTAFGFQFGLSMFYALAGYAVVYLLFAWLAVPKIWEWGHKIKALTIGDLIEHRTQSKFAKQITNIIVILTSLIWISVSVTGGAKVLEYLNIPGGFTTGVFATCSFSLIYLLFSGYKGVIITDILQALIIILFSSIIGYAIFIQPDLTLALQQENSTIDTSIVVALALFGLGFLTSPDRYQLAYAAKSKKVAQLGMAIPVGFILGLAFILVVMGQYAKFINPAGNADDAFIYILTSILPSWIAPFGLVLLMAAIMSTIDSIVYAVASHAPWYKNIKPSRNSLRVSMIITVLFLALIALSIKSIINLSLLSVVMTLIGSMSMLYILCGGKSTFIYLSTLLGGILGAAIGLLVLGIQPITIIVTLIGGLVFLIGSMIINKLILNVT